MADEENSEKGLVNVAKKYKMSGKLLNQDEIDDIVKKFKKEKKS